MPSMKVLCKRLPSLNTATSCAATVGIFDGIHRGHVWIIKKVLSVARSAYDCFPVVITFFPAPEYVLHKAEHFHLTDIEEKIDYIQKAGCPYYMVLRFDRRLAEYSGEKFIQELLTLLPLKHLIVGEDFKFGKNRYHGISFLKTFLKQRRGSVRIIKKRKSHHLPVSSSQIRDLLRNGRIEQANDLLNRAYAVTGTVIKGKGIGALLGVATANIDSAKHKVIPAQGVYAVFVTIDTKEYQGVCNIGFNPTIAGRLEKLSLEVHLLHFHQSIVGKKITVRFLKRIRDEKKFLSLHDLREAIEKDIVACRDYFASRH